MKNKIYSILALSFFLLNSILAFTPGAQIICPDDITISCCQDFNDLDITGDPANYNPDMNYFTKEDSLGIDACRVGEINRKWIGHNVLGQFNCYQFITMIRENQFNGDIDWPADWTGQCGDEIPYFEPLYDIGFCDQIAHNFKDDTFRFIDDACMKILRNWTIIDWCVYTPNSYSNNGKWEHTQVLMIVDKTVPKITECPKNITIPALNQNCSATFSLEKKANDPNCGGAISPLKWYYEIDINNDWQIDSTGQINKQEAKIELSDIPVGKHTIKWKVFDGCANVSTCMQTINVIDKKPPTLICYLSTTFNITSMPGADTLDYPAKNFVKEAYDNCTADEDIIISFTPDPKDSIKTFTCWDLGFQFFRIFAIDKKGNSTYVYVLARVSINGSCNFASVEGTVTDLSDNPVEGIDIALTGNGNNYIVDKTKNTGEFSFPYKKSDFEPKIHLSVNNNFNPDISTNDIKFMINYLLGKTKLNKYQKLAADINNDGNISIADVRILRNILLGKTKYSSLEKPALFYIDTAQGLQEIEYIENLDQNINVKCILKGNLTKALYPSHQSQHRLE